MSDFVVNIRQISQYPLTTTADEFDLLLMQRGGVGGAYYSCNAQELVATALEDGHASMGVGNTPPDDSGGGQVFLNNAVFPTPNGGLLWNAYYDANGVLRYWKAGPAAEMSYDPSGGLIYTIFPPGQADGQVGQGSTGFDVSNNGCMTIPNCTLTVGQDAVNDMDVVPLGQFDTKLAAAIAQATQDIFANMALMYLPLTGGTMHGPLILNRDAQAPFEAVTLQQLQSYTQGEYLPITGGTMQGPLVLAGAGTNPNDAVTYSQLVNLLEAVTGGDLADLSGFMPINGGTFTGAVQLHNDAVTAMQPVTLQQLQSYTANLTEGFLPLSGGTLTGQLNTVPPELPQNAVNKEYVDALVGAMRRFIDTWHVATNQPNIILPATHIDGDYYIAVTAVPNQQEQAPSAVPGIGGNMINNGDIIIWSDAAHQWEQIRGGPLNLVEADELFVSKLGDAMQGPLSLVGNATTSLEAVPLQQLNTAIGAITVQIPNFVTQTYLQTQLQHYMPLVGGDFLGPVHMFSNAVDALSPVTLQQMNDALAALGGETPDMSGFVNRSGDTMTGPLILFGNATQNLGAVTLQQLNDAIAPLGSGIQNPTSAGSFLRTNTGTWVLGVPASGGTMTGPLILSGNSTNNLGAVTLQQMNAAVGNAGVGVFLPLTGGTLTGPVIMQGTNANLTLNGNATANLQPVPLQQLNAATANFITQAQLNNYVLKSGDTMTGALYQNSGNIILGAAGGNNIYFSLTAGGGSGLRNTFTLGTDSTFHWYGANTAGNINRDLMTSNPGWVQPQFNNGCFFFGDTAFTIGQDSQARYFEFGNGWWFAWNMSNGILDWTGSGAFMRWNPGNGICQNIKGGIWAYGFVDTCDEKTKQDIRAEKRGLDVIRKLHPIDFRRRQRPGRVEVGFSAQDVQAALPEAVSANDTPTGEPLEHGKEVPTESLLGVNLGAVLAVLVNAVNELAAEIEMLKAQRA
jgi:hypothetical protein